MKLRNLGLFHFFRLIYPKYFLWHKPNI
jgi:hypothetical protein